MNKLFTNVLSFVLASLSVLGLLYFSKNYILAYYAKPLKDSLQKTIGLQNDLESGKIVVFGSSELVMYPHQKFLPQNFFNNDLKLPLRAQGNEGQQTFAILSQLAAYHSDELIENARVVILVSPSWFTGNYDNGTKIPKFLEFMYPGMMNKLYYESNVDDAYKELINNYVQKNIPYMKDPGFIYQYTYSELSHDYLDNEIKKTLIKSFEQKETHPSLVIYSTQNIDFKTLETQAKALATPSTNNSFGIYNEYFTKFIEPSIQRNEFPFSIMVPSDLNKNQEYQDFLHLLELCKEYKTKPLFIIEDLHPYVFIKNRDEMNTIILTIKEKIEEKGYPYLDMWTYKKEDFEVGTLTDIVHLGELGWIKVNQKIIDYFITHKGNAQ